MTEPRKTVLILGNGFDLDLGLKTSYKDFWESDLCPKDYPAPLIRHLNQCWKDNLEAVKWYDLENELLKYYLGLRDPDKGEDFITEEEREFLRQFQPLNYQFGIYNDKHNLIQSLVKKGILIYQLYRHPQISENHKEDCLKSPIWRDRKALELIKESLCRYLKSQSPRCPANTSTIAFQVLNFLDREAGQGNRILDVYTFNYTRAQINGADPDNANIHYMHGKCDDGKIIIGTREDKSFHESYDFLQKAFDPAFNPPALVEDLRKADEVVIFGHSIGENDRQYFKSFFKQQTDYSYSRRKDIIVFTLNDNSEIQIKHALNMLTDGNLSTLYSLNNIQIIKTGNIEEDQRLLHDFLIKHGKEDCSTEEFIGQLLKKN